jgi:hypothetical protein
MSNFFNTLFRRRKPFRRGPAQPVPPSPGADEPLQVTVIKTLVIVYDPVVDPVTGRTLAEHLRWNRVDELARGYMSDVLEVSGGLARFQVVQRIDVDGTPVKVDGYQYDPATYLNVMRGATPPHSPTEVDYYAIINRFEILQRVAANEIDEVWVFSFPHAGFYESIMGGPGAFWCNAPPLKNTEASGRRFVIMGFSYERGVGEMLEDLGHRAESIMEKTFEGHTGEQNLWRRFIRYQKVAPGRAAVGNIHFAPNSQRDYDWNNPTPVSSECDDWLYNFPSFKGVVRTVTASDWGNGDIREHHKWWFRHLPKVPGYSYGISNNWWQYIMDPNLVPTKQT